MRKKLRPALIFEHPRRNTNETTAHDPKIDGPVFIVHDLQAQRIFVYTINEIEIKRGVGREGEREWERGEALQEVLLQRCCWGLSARAPHRVVFLRSLPLTGRGARP